MGEIVRFQAGGEFCGLFLKKSFRKGFQANWLKRSVSEMWPARAGKHEWKAIVNGCTHSGEIERLMNERASFVRSATRKACVVGPGGGEYAEEMAHRLQAVRDMAQLPQALRTLPTCKYAIFTWL